MDKVPHARTVAVIKKVQADFVAAAQRSLAGSPAGATVDSTRLVVLAWGSPRLAYESVVVGR